VKNAEISGAKKHYPLIVVSHGTGGSALQMMWLGQYLAARGFIVAAVNHHGNTGAEEKYQAQGFILWWERARDLTVAIDKLLADSKFGTHIDSKRIGAAGFSLGGSTVTSLAGGIFAIENFNKFCASPERDATCDPQPEYAAATKEFDELKTKDSIVIGSLKRAGMSYKDSRIKAIFAIAPALGASFTPTSLSSIKIPFQMVVGESDATTPAKTNAQKIAQFVKNSDVTISPGKVAHYTFLSDCTAFGKTILPICRDDESVNREEIHRKVSQMAFEFFRRKL
jgi:predicted dienelactone hydrolase